MYLHSRTASIPTRSATSGHGSRVTGHRNRYLYDGLRSNAVSEEGAAGGLSPIESSSVSAIQQAAHSVQLASLDGYANEGGKLQGIWSRNRDKVHGRMLRILVVDDAPMNRKMLCRFLKTRCEVLHEAEDGAEAVELVKTALHTDVPYNVVLMDNQMPNMTGPEAATEMRGHRCGYKGCIIGITGNAMEEDRQQYINCGAEYVLCKPVDVTQLDDLLSGEGLSGVILLAVTRLHFVSRISFCHIFVVCEQVIVVNPSLSIFEYEYVCNYVLLLIFLMSWDQDII